MLFVIPQILRFISFTSCKCYFYANLHFQFNLAKNTYAHYTKQNQTTHFPFSSLSTSLPHSLARQLLILKYRMIEIDVDGKHFHFSIDGKTQCLQSFVGVLPTIERNITCEKDVFNLIQNVCLIH